LFCNKNRTMNGYIPQKDLIQIIVNITEDII